ncbi:MAG TPA: hypothetical protein VIH68_01475 [Bacteroidota bacterium]
MNLTYGLRADFPIYFTDPVDNPFSRGLRLLDENDNPETVDQSKLPGAKPLFSPRIGFNWDVKGDRSTQVRGGSGIFTGRLPFVWVGNNISNPGPNPNLPAYLRTGDINAMDPDFKWPQVWNTNLAIDHKLPWELLGTLEVIYGKDINAIFIRNANLRAPVRNLPAPDGRPYFGGAGNNKNDATGGGVYVIDNTSDGHLINLTGQLRKNFEFGLNATVSYGFLESKNQLSSTEIAQFFWEFNPVKGDPNKPEVSFSEFGHKHRFVGGATYTKRWSDNLATHFGLYAEVAQGAASTAGARSRFSYTYAGDVNGDGVGGNDLIYIPRNASDIVFDPAFAPPADQWAAFNAFIEQDKYLSSHRGQIAERNGGTNPWFTSLDLRVLQDLSFSVAGQRNTLQLSLDIFNVLNLISSDWGVREVANTAAKTPLVFTGQFDASGAPIFQFPGIAKKTYLDDASVISRWQLQLGARYSF